MEHNVLGGRYELLRPIGHGGMADVWAGRDTMLGREVAIKILHSGYAADPRFVERFRREAQAAARLNHPNIAAV
jgi:eukaryotic-like serine/threonine-protein kinase